MSFGRPPSINAGFKPSAPDRGSFPLDHFGECKTKMQLYMDCLEKNSGNSTQCRELSKDYLQCRMNNGLMEKDEWKNLGLANLDRNKTAAAAPLPATSGMPEGKKSNSPPDSPTATL